MTAESTRASDGAQTSAKCQIARCTRTGSSSFVSDLVEENIDIGLGRARVKDAVGGVPAETDIAPIAGVVEGVNDSRSLAKAEHKIYVTEHTDNTMSASGGICEAFKDKLGVCGKLDPLTSSATVKLERDVSSEDKHLTGHVGNAMSNSQGSSKQCSGWKADTSNLHCKEEPAESKRGINKPATEIIVTDDGGTTDEAQLASGCIQLGQVQCAREQWCRPVAEKLHFRVQKLGGVSHRDATILSVDFAPSTTGPRQRLLSSGQDGTVKVWALQAGQTSATDDASFIEKTVTHDLGMEDCAWLATLDEHAAPVNCARWSPDAGLIASGDADSVLLIWAPGRGGAHATSSATAAGPEPWHRRFLLRGHRLEICDLSWHHSPYARFGLASCSHDGTIILWNVLRGEMTSRIEIPGGGVVKGISFDPLGQFLACMVDAAGVSNRTFAMLWESPGDDVGVDVTSKSAGGEEWRLVTVSSKPWSKPSLLGTAVYFRRPSWDPLGQSLCFPYGEYMRCEMSTPRYFGALFARGAWHDPQLYRGHLQRVSTVRFAPVVFGQAGEATEASVLFAMCSQDGSLSLWLSSLPAPLVVLQDLVDENCIITDVAWAPDGQSLALASNDGSVAIIEIDFGPTKDGQKCWSHLDVERWRFEQQLHVHTPTWDLPAGSWDPSLSASKRLRGSAKLSSPKRPRKEIDCLDGNRRRPHHQSTCVGLGLSTWDLPADRLLFGGAISEASDVADVHNSVAWDPPPQLSEALRRRRPAGGWAVLDASGCCELRVEPVAMAGIGGDRVSNGFARVSLCDRRASLTALRGGAGVRRWQFLLSGRVQCAQLGAEFAVLILEDNARHELLIVDVASGRVCRPPLSIETKPTEMRFLEVARNHFILILGEDMTLSLFEISGNSFKLILTAAMPLLPDSLLELGLLPAGTPSTAAGVSRGAPYVRLTDGCVLAYHDELRAWLALDAWRYIGSPLQCRGPLPCPREGALSELLWDWRCLPAVPRDWQPLDLAWAAAAAAAAASSEKTEGSGFGLDQRATRAHVERRAQLCHEFTALLLFGTGEEAECALRDVLGYSATIDDAALVDDLIGRSLCWWGAKDVGAFFGAGVPRWHGRAT
eukprot:TRINITY_DN15778_c0_g1_i1.p1 TRINITY_DN15778_c0_g1~~TRINITY_DN15778_c0_g1_i1.p1  ORF type:complete len:1109 (-),score=155.07 TRINITY_DN15778_c0_g1_i1:159-3485(-)